MDYSEYEVPASLRPHVQCLWRLRDPAPPSAAQTIYPDGRCELIVHLASPMQRQASTGEWETQGRCLFAAQTRSAIRLRALHTIDCLGARLRPEASAVLFDHGAAGAPTLASLADQVVDLSLLDALLAQRLQHTLDPRSATLAATFARVLSEHLAQRPTDPRLAAIVALIDQHHGNLALHALAQAMHASPRTLQTRFLAAVGMTVKEYALVQRLQATIRALDEDRHALAQTALSAGFSDQAHATRAVQAFTGLTPARLRRALAAERDGDRTLALAAAFVRGRAAAQGPRYAHPR